MYYSYYCIKYGDMRKNVRDMRGYSLSDLKQKEIL